VKDWVFDGAGGGEGAKVEVVVELRDAQLQRERLREADGANLTELLLAEAAAEAGEPLRELKQLMYRLGFAQ